MIINSSEKYFKRLVISFQSRELYLSGGIIISDFPYIRNHFISYQFFKHFTLIQYSFSKYFNYSGLTIRGYHTCTESNFCF